MIQTKRLILRKWKKSDAKDLAKNANNKKINKTNPHIPYPCKTKDADEYINKCIKNYKKKKPKQISFALENKKEVIGCVDFHGIKWENLRADIGGWIAEKRWNQGLMTEAVSCIVNYARNNLNLVKITAKLFVFNKSSAKVMKKTGFRLVGILKKDTKIGNKFVDSYLYEKLL